MMKQKCVFCLKKKAFTIQCSSCLNQYCTTHLLPEIHHCCNIENIKHQKDTLHLEKIVCKKIDKI